MKNELFENIGNFFKTKINKNNDLIYFSQEIEKNDTSQNNESNIDLSKEACIDSNKVFINEDNVNNIDENVRLINISDIVIDPVFSKEFDIDENVLNRIKLSMEKNGYDLSQPIVVWEHEGKTILVEGHTRVRAVRELNKKTLYAINKPFKNREEAYMYVKNRQIDRRNLKDKDLFKYLMNQENESNPDEKGRLDEVQAKKLNISTSKVTHAKYVMKYASDEDKELIDKGEKTFNKVYQEIKEKKKDNEVKIESKINEYNNDKSTHKKEDKTHNKMIIKKITLEQIISLLVSNNEISALKLIKDNYGDKLPKELFEINNLSINKDLNKDEKC